MNFHMHDTDKPRCGWVSDPLMVRYHDEEWGVPVHDDSKLFEFMVLDAFQAGLSWKTILYKRENFRKAFDDFNPLVISEYGETKYEALLQDTGIIRNRAKITGTIVNARLFLGIQKEFGSFDQYLWAYVNGRTIQNAWASLSEIPSRTEISDRLSDDLKKRGFKFAGSTICYSFMQAAGLVNDHVTGCFRYRELL